jgi:hypothetical protein
MNAGETWDVPGVALARRTGSENSIGPGMLECQLLSVLREGRCREGNIHQELVRCLLEVGHCSNG